MIRRGFFCNKMSLLPVKRVTPTVIDVDTSTEYWNKKQEFTALYTGDLADPKVEFRYFCYRYLDYMRLFTVPDVPKVSVNEAVLIEYRAFPHVEFLVRNMIRKVGASWSYTIVCGTANYDFMVGLAAAIHPNINVIKTPYDNLTPSLYSKLLASAEFWNLLHGDKILIYQEDSIIFGKNIGDFLEWDYIGAPWPRGQNDTPNAVGNGGFSLRTRQVMLDVITRRSIEETVPASSTASYMAATDSTVLPEDVYFSKNIQELGLGRVAPWESAFAFSSESQHSQNSLGGHNFWISDPNWKKRLYTSVVVNFSPRTHLKTTHRGGWAAVMDSLRERDVLYGSAQYDLLPVTEEVYLWKDERLRPTKPWIGIIHCTPITPDYHKEINIQYLMQSGAFLDDLKKCKALVALSESVADFLRTNIVNPPPILSLIHPVVYNAEIPMFTMEKYVANTDKHILQIGQQLRKVTSIFRINPPGFNRRWLTGTPDLNHCKMMIQRELAGAKNIPIDYNILYYTKTFEEYDELLSANVVFIDLFDSAANNTVLECIVRNTPILLNRTPGVVEYLGAAYPLYFDTLDQIEGLLTIDRLTAAHKYLASMDKEKFTMEYFVRRFTDTLCN